MPSLDPIRRFEEILENAEAIADYIDGMDFAAYSTDRKTIDAVERCLERISEASRGLGSDARNLAPGQPWREIMDLGNALRHAYHKIRLSEIWEAVTRELPPLAEDARAALDQLRQQSNKP